MIFLWKLAVELDRQLIRHLCNCAFVAQPPPSRCVHKLVHLERRLLRRFGNEAEAQKDFDIILKRISDRFVIRAQ